MKRVENLLRERIGLDVASIGETVVARTVRLRMKELGLATPDQYCRRLDQSETEWRRLVEAVVVKETWFFRDPGAFTALVQLIYEEWLPKHPARTLRLLSLPCSTGEEPYSLAIALHEAQFPLERVVIDAVDLSQDALNCAQAGSYGRNSFRGKNLAFRDRWFQKTKDNYQLLPHPREPVHFHQANVLQPDAAVLAGPYDFIFCRNLLIYFDRPTQAHALQRLHRWLSDDGCLFVGPAELPLVQEHGFRMANLPLAFASRKAGKNGAGTSPAAAKAPPAARSAHRDPTPIVPPLPSEQVRLTLPHPTARAGAASPDLDAAHQLADAGRYPEALALCESHLHCHGPTARAYYLLGLVRDANGEPAALECYRKALYLDPNHYETLVQMALLLEKQGDRNAARNCRRRAARLKETGVAS